MLVTGVAGFIGSHVAARLLAAGREVIGVDSVSDYYDVELKYARLGRLGLPADGVQALRRGESAACPGLTVHRFDLKERSRCEGLFAGGRVESVVHLAAQAGVRFSLTSPHSYAESNLDAFLNILEGCRHHPVRHLVFASSSSVYGGNRGMPFSVHQNVDHPLSLYAATKKANELMAHAYAHLYAIPVTGLRFFTVYGPWGRPDMAAFLFCERILRNQPIEVFNHGRMRRDFTYIDDIVEGVVRVLDRPPVPDPAWDGARPDPATSAAPYRVFNIGHHQPVELLDFIALIEECLGRRAEKVLLPMQPGDVPETYADIEDLRAWVGFAPRTSIREGVPRFVDWYRRYYGV